jgi:hypothetical protein
MDEQEYPAWYSIDALFNSGVQPFDDWSPDELEALSKAIGSGRRPLADPVKVGRDGTLLDGHQRLKAMRMAGRTRIYAGDVRVVAAADASNALDYAVELNAGRRHLTTEQKQRLAYTLNKERRWPQTKIATKMHVTQGRVSQWIAAERRALEAELEEPNDDAEQPDGETKGGSRPPGRPSVQYPPWAFKGSAGKLLVKAQSTMATLTSVPFEAIDAERRKGIAWSLAEIADAANTLRRRLDGEPMTVPIEGDDQPEG